MKSEVRKKKKNRLTRSNSEAFNTLVVLGSEFTMHLRVLFLRSRLLELGHAWLATTAGPHVLDFDPWTHGRTS